MKSAFFLAFWFCTGTLLAQYSGDDVPRTQTPADTSVPLLERPLEAARDFLNFYAFANGIVDTNGYLAGSLTNQSGVGIEAGAGVSGYHAFSRGDLSLNYRGGYRDYFSTGYPSGNDQSLNFTFKRVLGKRWLFQFGEQAGILLFGGTYYGLSPSQVNQIQTNPFTTETRYEGTTASVSYQQSLRLSYEFAGSFYLQRYKGGYNIGTNSTSGTGAVLYRITKRTTVSGNYSYQSFVYQRNAGSSNANSLYLTVSHHFPSHWSVGVSAGITRADSSGTAPIPVPVQLGNQILTVYVLGRYSQVSTLPYLQATVSHDWRHSSFYVTGGETVTPGNGFYLTSRSLGLNGLWSYTMRRSNVTMGGYFSRFSSLSNTIRVPFSTGGYTASYAYNLRRYFGVNAGLLYANYGAFGGYGGREDTRLSFGVYFTSRNVPVAIF